MILTVTRDLFDPAWTLSTWDIGGVPECYGIEDCDRYLERNPEAKVYGRTAIPRGQYNVIVSFSPRFKRDLPLLIGVKGFDGVRIHPGNTAGDTEGCLLPGSVREAGKVLNSRMAFERLFDKIKKAYNVGDDIEVVIK